MAFVLIVWAIVMRYAFNAAPTWVDDIAGFSLVAVVMLAAAQTLRRGEHIGVDLLVTNLSPTGRRWANAWAALATAAIAGVLVVKGWESAMFS
ncbi:MAG: TRAP transporter small permease, partial [Caldimonas sp.]